MQVDYFKIKPPNTFPVLEMVKRTKGKVASYMDEDSDDDFVDEAPAPKKKAKTSKALEKTANKTSTQDPEIAPIFASGKILKGLFSCMK